MPPDRGRTIGEQIAHRARIGRGYEMAPGVTVRDTEPVLAEAERRRLDAPEL